MTDVPEGWTVPWDQLPSEEEAEELGKANPKGRLNEFCQRVKCARPKLTIERRGTVWGIEMHLRLRTRELTSGMQWAWERKLAEQMAARALLGQLAGDQDEGEPEEWISDEEAKRFAASNPKGTLLERCTLLRLTPTFDVHPLVTERGPGYEGSAHVTLPDGEEVWSDIRRGSSAKTVEHAVAASLIERLPTELPSPAPPTDAAVVSAALGTVTGEPRSMLNELRQKGLLRDYGFSLERTEGPSHAPRFHFSGYAVRPTGERIAIEGITAASKKEGERITAHRLVERLLSTSLAGTTA